MKITPKLTFAKLPLTLLIALGTASAAFAQGETGTATLNGVQNGSLFDYTLTLNNTGTTPIGTFWYAWVPGGFFLPSTPASATAPTGWTADIFQSYSIQYTANSSADYLAGGSSLNFSFTSTDTPVALAGNVPIGTYAGTPIGTSYIYSAAPFSDSGYEFVVQSVPEPSVLGLLTAGFLGLVSTRRWKLRRPGTVIG